MHISLAFCTLLPVLVRGPSLPLYERLPFVGGRKFVTRGLACSREFTFVGATLGTYLEFYFTDRKDGWELRGRRVEINFDEMREARDKFFRLVRPREPQRKSLFLPAYVCGRLVSSLFRSLAREHWRILLLKLKEVLLRTRLVILKRLSLQPSLFNLQRYCTSCNFTEDCNRSPRFCIFNRQCCSKMLE